MHKKYTKYIGFVSCLIFGIILLNYLNHMTEKEQLAVMATNTDMNKEVTVYTIDPCPYCSSAKMLLQQNGITYKEIKLSRTEQDKIIELSQKTGMRTFPQILYGDELIGGFTELKALHDKKGLANVLV